MELIDFGEMAKTMTLSDFEEYAKNMPNVNDLFDEFKKVERNGKPKKFKGYYADPEFRKKIKIDYKHLLNALSVILRQVSAI